MWLIEKIDRRQLFSKNKILNLIDHIEILIRIKVLACKLNNCMGRVQVPLPVNFVLLLP